LLSFIFLKRRCRDCGAKISWRYPFVELIAAVILLLLYLEYGFAIDFFRFGFFFLLLIVVSMIDIEYHAIPIVLCFAGICLGLTFNLFETVLLIKRGFLSANSLVNLPIVAGFRNLFFAFGFAYFFKFFGDIGLNIYLSWRKKDSIEGEKESLGLGDVDFMGMVGVYLGLSKAVMVFFIAPFVAIIYAVFALIFKKSHLIPYLPYLSVASLIVYYWGDKILFMLTM
jgi:leader peptidase (prepilin peptidase)/N-methyltransferase